MNVFPTDSEANKICTKMNICHLIFNNYQIKSFSFQILTIHLQTEFFHNSVSNSWYWKQMFDLWHKTRIQTHILRNQFLHHLQTPAKESATKKGESDRILKWLVIYVYSFKHPYPLPQHKHKNTQKSLFSLWKHGDLLQQKVICANSSPSSSYNCHSLQGLGRSPRS